MNNSHTPNDLPATGYEPTLEENHSTNPSDSEGAELHIHTDSITSSGNVQFGNRAMMDQVDDLDDEEEFDDELSTSESLDTFKDKFEQLLSDESFIDVMSELDVLTLEECAVYLKIKFGDVRRLIKEQGLPGRKIGEEWRFLRGAVAEWLGNPGLFETSGQFADQVRFEAAPPRPKHKKRDRRDDREDFEVVETNFRDRDEPPRRDIHRSTNQRRRRYGHDQDSESTGEERSTRYRREQSDESNFIEGGNRPSRQRRVSSRDSKSGGPKKSRREALSNQRFKRLDRRRFGDQPTE